MDIHRCRFVPYPPSAINALAFSHSSLPTTPGKGPSSLRLALGRANGDIEIWNPNEGSWYQETILRGGKDRSIEGLVWTQNSEDTDQNGHTVLGKLRLFSIGYSTAVTEWDLASGRPIQHSAGNYGEIWCMAVQPKGEAPNVNQAGREAQMSQEMENQTQNIAVGCADGTIVLFSTADNDLRFTRVLARPSKKKSRVLSISFQNRHTIIAGHADSAIRIYDMRQGQQMRSMTLGAGPKGGPKEILVWSVKCLPDGTIVSGDSTGTVCFWDGNNYTLVQRIKSHEADVLDLAVSADGRSVFSGGMDRRTTLHKPTGSGRSGERLRWAKAIHQRLHKHDVKTMATFETRALSIMVSGGLDATPIVVPIQEFGREHHRSLPSLPQQPNIRSAPKKRLVMSWWDRELSIWRIEKYRKEQLGRATSPSVYKPPGRKLVAKIAIQGEESITSADLSSDGSILAVSTVAELKLFRLHHRSETLRVHKVEINRGVSRRAAKLLQFSPDSKWLATTGADDSVQLQRLLGNNKSRQIPNAWPKAVGLKRLRRDLAKAKNKDSSLGNYNRSISCLAFSTDSRILAVSDNSGFLDTWVLEGYEDLTQEDDVEPGRVGSSLSSDDEDSEEDSPTVILGQHWIRNPAASLLVKLPAAPSVLSFRPSNTQSASAQGNGNTAVHPTRHNPHPHSHDLPHGEDRLFVITAKNQMYEFNVLSGKLSDWSRRNPTSSLPRAFRDLRDRAKGVLWDIGGRSERIWLYGVAWLWMFDLSKDLPVVGHELNELQAANGINGDVSLKRKRENEVSTSKHKRRDTGAGSKISETELGVGIGRKIRKLNGADVNGGEWISLDREQESASDEEGSYVLADEHNSALVKIRRGTGDVAQLLNGPADETDASETDDTRLAKRGDDERPPYWHTYKYRPILGIVPLGTETDDDDAAVDEEAGDNSPSGLEVALVERPLWEVDLPPQYHGNQEWDP